MINLFFPYWAFQKNANRQMFDVLFSPAGAYRLGVMRRAYTEGSEVISTLLYQGTVDEFGLDYRNMNPEERDQYDTLRYARVQESGTIDKMPPAVLLDIRNWMAGKITNATLSDGALRSAPEIQALLRENANLADYYIEQPDKLYERSYRQGRPGVRLPFPLTKSVKTYVDLLRQENKDAPFATIFAPEPMWESAFKHMGYQVAALVLAMDELGAAAGISLISDEDDGLGAVAPMDPLLEVWNPGRAMIVPQVLTTAGADLGAFPTPLHPLIGKLAAQHNFDVLILDATDDALSEMALIREARETGEEIPPKAGVIRDPRYYLMPGMPQLLYMNNPLMEINRLILLREKTPIEERAELRGELLRLCRSVFGLDVEEVYRGRAVKFTRYDASRELGSEEIRKTIKKGQGTRSRDKGP